MSQLTTFKNLFYNAEYYKHLYNINKQKCLPLNYFVIRKKVVSIGNALLLDRGIQVHIKLKIRVTDLFILLSVIAIQKNDKKEYIVIYL